MVVRYGSHHSYSDTDSNCSVDYHLLTFNCSNNVRVQGKIFLCSMDCRFFQNILSKQMVHKAQGHCCRLGSCFCMIEVRSGQPDSSIASNCNCINTCTLKRGDDKGKFMKCTLAIVIGRHLLHSFFIRTLFSDPGCIFLFFC